MDNSFKDFNKLFKDEYTCFKLSFEKKYVLEIILVRSKSFNSFNILFFEEIYDVYKTLIDSSYYDIRVVVIKSSSDNFTSGIDIKSIPQIIADSDFPDPARKAVFLDKFIKKMQDSFSIIEECNIPTIVVIKGLCLGAGIDLLLACDIQIATPSSKFCNIISNI